MCHQAKGNRTIEVNHNLNRFRTIAKEKLLSDQGLFHRSRRPIEPEAVFSQAKSNNRFNRFSLRGIEKMIIEKISILGQGGGYMITPTHIIQNDVSPEKVKKFIDLCLKHGNYKITK